MQEAIFTGVIKLKDVKFEVFLQKRKFFLMLCYNQIKSTFIFIFCKHRGWKKGEAK
jgi:hypothetical protein